MKEFPQGLTPVQNENNKWGFITSAGTLRIVCKYSNIMPFSENLILVKYESCDNWILINCDGVRNGTAEYKQVGMPCNDEIKCENCQNYKEKDGN